MLYTKIEKTLLTLKNIVIITVFYGALQFEGAQGSRMTVLIALFLVFLSIGIIRNVAFKRDPKYNYTYLLDIVLVLLLEHNSKYLINYFFHSFYIIILIEVSLILKRHSSLVIGGIAVIASLNKYFTLIYYKKNLASISEMIFFTIIGAFILVIVNFLQYYKDEKEKKDLLYRELLGTHKKLKEYNKRVEELTIVEERSRIARDIHDTLGHSMTGTIMEMEMVYHLLDEDTANAKELLAKCKKSARDNLVQIREVVETLKIDDRISKGIDSIKELIEEFSCKTQIEISLNITGEETKLDPTTNIALYRVIQEAITNAVRHGKASKISVILGFFQDRVTFVIENNGICYSNIEEGFGIGNMKDRVLNLNGEIQVIFEEPFTVKGYMPIEGGAQ